MHQSICARPTSTPATRREFLYGLGASLGAVAMSDLLAKESAVTGPLAPRPAMHEPRAKACIMLFMEGGPGHMDTFDPKPKLNELHKEESKLKGGLASGYKFFVEVRFSFVRWVSPGSR